MNKVILASLSPLWAVGIQSGIGAATLFLLSIGRGRLVVPPRADVPVLLSLPLLHMVGFGVLAAVGLALVPTGRSVVLAYTTPLWVAPGAAVFLGEPFTRRRLIGVVAGMLGLAVLFNPLAFDWSRRDAVLGNAAVLAAAMLWAASVLHLRGHRWRSTPFDLVPWQSLIATAVVIPIALAVDGVPAIDWNTGLVLMLVYAGVPATALAYWAMAMAGRSLPALTTSLGLLATPVISVVIATVWLGESLTASLVIAIVLILGGVAIGTTGDAASPSGRPQPATQPYQR